jgi:ATP-dependent helicase Lhr and Lhr-like helicase
VLAAAEESGRVRRGYFVEGLGAAQFATTGAVDRLRAQSRPLDTPRRSDDQPLAVVLAACDPANPFGGALPWPDRTGSDELDGPGLSPAATDGTGTATGAPTKTSRGHQPARKAGALVVCVDGELVLYVERGGKSLLTWPVGLDALQRAADALALAVREGALGRLTVERTDGSQVLGSGHPVAEALSRAGFHATPRGLRLRR